MTAKPQKGRGAACTATSPHRPEAAPHARAPRRPALTRPRALRVPQLSLEAHARELFRAGPLGRAHGGSRAVPAAAGLPLGDPHAARAGSRAAHTYGRGSGKLWQELQTAVYTCAGRGGASGSKAGGRGGPRSGQAEEAGTRGGA